MEYFPPHTADPNVFSPNIIVLSGDFDMIVLEMSAFFSLEHPICTYISTCTS